MKKILSAIAALALGAGLAVSAALPAQATHPQVSGNAVCNTATGNYDVTWNVSGDPGYPDVTWEFVSADRVSDQIVGKTGTGGAGFTATETVTGKQTLHLTVGIQFSNHAPGDVVTNKGSVVITENCEAPKVYPPVITPATPQPTPPTCDVDGSYAFPSGAPAAENDGKPIAGAAPGTQQVQRGVTLDGYHLYVRNTTGEFGAPGEYKWQAYGIGANGTTAYPLGTSVGGKVDNQGNPKAGGMVEGTFTVGAKTGNCPQTVNECPAFTSRHITSLSELELGETSTDGSAYVRLTANGLRLHTNDTGHRKAAFYIDTNFALRDLGDFQITGSGTGVEPGGQVRTDRTGDGAWDFTIVDEPIYGGIQWGSIPGGGTWVPQPWAPHVAGGGGYPNQGTYNDWLTTLVGTGSTPSVDKVGASLGSGVTGDYVITKLVAGCVEYTFGAPAAPEPETRDNTVVGEPDCEAGTVTSTTTFEAREPLAWDEATQSYPWGEWEVTGTREVVRDATDAECPPPVTPPTAKPPVPGLAVTGGNPVFPLIWGGLALVAAGALALVGRKLLREQG